MIVICLRLLLFLVILATIFVVGRSLGAPAIKRAGRRRTDSNRNDIHGVRSALAVLSWVGFLTPVLVMAPVLVKWTGDEPRPLGLRSLVFFLSLGLLAYSYLLFGMRRSK